MGLFNLPLTDSDITAWFIFEGNEYEMSQFNISFNQAVDHKGEPQDETRGGHMLIVLTQAVPDNIYKWAMTSIPRGGKILFRSNTESAPLKVEFTNAYCVSFARSVSANGGINTSMTISPDKVVVNGITLDNRWV